MSAVSSAPCSHAAIAADLLLSPRGEVHLLVEIAQRAGLTNDHGPREKLAILIALGYLEERRNVDVKPNGAVRYQIADAVFRFYHRFVAQTAKMREDFTRRELLRELREEPLLRISAPLPVASPAIFLALIRSLGAPAAPDRRPQAAVLPAATAWRNSTAAVQGGAALVEIGPA